VEIKVETIGEVQCLRLRGHLDHDGAFQLFEIASPMLGHQGAGVVLDLEGCDYVNSIGYGMVIRLLKTSADHQSHLLVSGLRGPVRENFDLMNFARLSTIYENPDEAIQSLAHLQQEKRR
jgi:anti-anti-sigma factor